MTTLADLPEKQRKACVGMWSDYRITPVVITNVYWYEYAQCWVADVFDPQEGWAEEKIHISVITPRYDLSRAWNADGTPVRGGTSEEPGVMIHVEQGEEIPNVA